MEGWAIALIIVGVLVFVLLYVLIVRSLSKQKPDETEEEKQASRDFAGEEAELLVNNKINSMIAHELDGKGVNHGKFIFFVNKKSQHTTEIDSLVVTKAGIFIIEVKGWKGEITSSDPDADKWAKVKKYHKTRDTYGYKETQSLTNPIKQNNRHVDKFWQLWKRFSHYKADIIPMVIFPYLENIPKDAYDIKSALSCIRQLSLDGDRDIAKIEGVITQMVKKYGATEEDHNRTLEELSRKHEMLRA